VALIRARAAIAKVKGDNHDQDAGVKIVLRAVEEPLRQIVQNAGVEPSVVVNNVAAGKGNYGYNASNETYGDMIEMGILDPTKVTRSALQNAASVAGLMLAVVCLYSMRLMECLREYQLPAFSCDHVILRILKYI